MIFYDKNFKEKTKYFCSFSAKCDYFMAKNYTKFSIYTFFLFTFFWQKAA